MACPLAANADPALKPNQPNQRMPGADHHERHRVRRLDVAWPHPALAQHEHGGEGGDAGVDVDDRATGEVERPRSPSQPVMTPSVQYPPYTQNRSGSTRG